jgi:hypothetical protein
MAEKWAVWRADRLGIYSAEHWDSTKVVSWAVTMVV